MSPKVKPGEEDEYDRLLQEAHELMAVARSQSQELVNELKTLEHLLTEHSE